ncbi:flavin reductase family protein [Microbacterium sp. NPDC089696]|uniref:flavin reductase family protein n=1 Tax=Microbacterium sp. NPDC089696 TaxID=3364199 RepID=UPI00381FBAB1
MTTKSELSRTEQPLVSDQSVSADSLSPDELRAAFRNHAAGVALVTADPGDGPVAMTATSVFSVSATPPLFVFSASQLSSATSAIERAESVVVHLLGANQLHLAKLGATPGIDRFADTSLWDRLPTGEPYFPAAPSWIRGTITNLYAAGGSSLVVVHATHSQHPPVDSTDASAEAVHPLVYHNRTWHRLGEHSALA